MSLDTELIEIAVDHHPPRRSDDLAMVPIVIARRSNANATAHRSPKPTAPQRRSSATNCAGAFPTTASSAKSSRITPDRASARGTSTRSTAPRHSAMACRCTATCSRCSTPAAAQWASSTSPRSTKSSTPAGASVAPYNGAPCHVSDTRRTRRRVLSRRAGSTIGRSGATADCSMPGAPCAPGATATATCSSRPAASMRWSTTKSSPTTSRRCR